MSPLPSRDDLLQRKAIEDAEIGRRREWALEEERGLKAACARYWELLEEFIVRARELGLQPRTHEPEATRGSASRIDWVEGYRLRSGSVVAAPPLRYCVKERRLVARPRAQILDVDVISLFVVTTDAGLAAGLSEPKTASSEDWPPIQRWDRAASILCALEAELEASLLALMDDLRAYSPPSRATPR